MPKLPEKTNSRKHSSLKTIGTNKTTEVRPNMKDVSIDVCRLNSSKTQVGSKSKTQIVRLQSEIFMICDGSLLEDAGIPNLAMLMALLHEVPKGQILQKQKKVENKFPHYYDEA